MCSPRPLRTPPERERPSLFDRFLSGTAQGSGWVVGIVVGLTAVYFAAQLAGWFVR